MCRKVALSAGEDATAYDASCLLVVELQENPAQDGRQADTPPDDLRAETFFTRMLDCLMTRSQSDDHREARTLWAAAGRAP
jgi:hypothetical protein